MSTTTEDRQRHKAQVLASQHQRAMANIARLEDRLCDERERARRLAREFDAAILNGKAGDDLLYTTDAVGGIRVLPRQDPTE